MRRARVLAGLAIIALVTLGNAGLAAYHSGVEWGFWQGPTACTGPVGNLGSAGNLLERLDTVKVVRCDEVQWKFLGLSLAGYDVLISLLMAGIAVWACAGPRSGRTHGGAAFGSALALSGAPSRMMKAPMPPIFETRFALLRMRATSPNRRHLPAAVRTDGRCRALRW